MYIYIILFIIISILSVIDIKYLVIPYYKKLRILVYCFFSALLILLSGLRKVGTGADDINYYNMYLLVKKGIIYKEYTFYIISKIFCNIKLVFLFYALISIGLTTIYIKKKSTYWFLILLFFYSSYFFLHDMIQIRVGVAAILGLFSLDYLQQKKHIQSVVFLIAGIFFHFSILVFLPLFFLRKFDNKLFYQLIISFSLIFSFSTSFELSSLSYYFPEIIAKRILFFSALTEESINLLNPLAIIHYLMILVFFYYWENFRQISNSLIYIQSFIFGVCALFIFRQFPSVGYRINELLLIVQIPLIDIFLNNVKQKSVLTILTIIYSFLNLYFILFHNEIIKAYSF